jgi:hypothetical protein
MTCPECGAHSHESAVFCTACGADLLAERKTHEPISVGSWKLESTEAPGMTTEPILGIASPARSDSAPVHPSPKRAAHRPTPVKEMVGSERSAWIDKVWGSAARLER